MPLEVDIVSPTKYCAYSIQYSEAKSRTELTYR